MRHTKRPLDLGKIVSSRQNLADDVRIGDVDHNQLGGNHLEEVPQLSVNFVLVNEAPVRAGIPNPAGEERRKDTVDKGSKQRTSGEYAVEDIEVQERYRNVGNPGLSRSSSITEETK